MVGSRTGRRGPYEVNSAETSASRRHSSSPRLTSGMHSARANASEAAEAAAPPTAISSSASKRFSAAAATPHAVTTAADPLSVGLISRLRKMARPSKCVYGSSTSRSADSRVSTSSRSPCSPSACASGGAAIVLESSRRGGGGGRASKAGTGSGVTETSFGDDRAWHIAGASSDVASIGSAGGAHGPSVLAADGGSTFWRLLVSSSMSSCTKLTRIM